MWGVNGVSDKEPATDLLIKTGKRTKQAGCPLFISVRQVWKQIRRREAQMLYTLFLTAAACAAILDVMVLVYGTVRWMQNT